MPPTSDELASAFAREAAQELDDALARIAHVLRQLTDAQVWERPRPEMNSFGNLALHLCGNLRQWGAVGISGGEDLRDRPSEFSALEGPSRDELLERLGAVVAEAKSAFAALSAADLVAPLRIQGHETTGMGAIVHTISHFRGHTQEIVHMARAVLGERYEFAWSPATKEQGAPT